MYKRQPGGQGVNTTDSRVELLLDLANCSCLGPFRRARLLEHFQARLVEGCLRVVVAEERSQWQNRQKALHRMGDLLLQVVLHAQIAREQQRFDLDAIADGISNKLIRRHPHVFGDVVASTSDEVRRSWEAIKLQEQAEALSLIHI